MRMMRPSRPSLPPSLAVRHKSLIGDGWLHAGGACHGYTYANNNRVEPIKKGGGSIAPLRRKENPSKKQKSILCIFLALRKCGSDCRSPGTTCCMRGRRKKIVASPPDLTTTYFHQIFPINFENFVFLQASLKEQIAMGDSEFHAALSCTYRKRGEESSQSGTYTYAGFFFRLLPGAVGEAKKGIATAKFKAAFDFWSERRRAHLGAFRLKE